MGNYRPVSLTSVVGKVFDTLINEWIGEHLSNFKIILGNQHGFTKGRLCFTNLLGFYEVILNWVDKESAVDVVYLDFQKALDKLLHRRLSAKVRACGLAGCILNCRCLAWRM